MEFTKATYTIGPWQVIACSENNYITNIDIIKEDKAQIGVDFKTMYASDPGRIPNAITGFFRELDIYFSGIPMEFHTPYRMEGSDFDKNIWSAAAKIPYGQTVSYSQIARMAGSPGATRAAGAALGRNRLPILIPCHRIIGADGSLTGFSGGLDLKRFLLDTEQGKSPSANK